MTAEEARQAITEVLAEVAPDADTAGLAPGADLRDTLALDSLDFLNFVEALGERSGRRIDEDDYPQLATLERGVAFLAGR